MPENDSNKQNDQKTDQNNDQKDSKEEVSIDKSSFNEEDAYFKAATHGTDLAPHNHPGRATHPVERTDERDEAK